MNKLNISKLIIKINLQKFTEKEIMIIGSLLEKGLDQRTKENFFVSLID